MSLGFQPGEGCEHPPRPILGQSPPEPLPLASVGVFGENVVLENCSGGVHGPWTWCAMQETGFWGAHLLDRNNHHRHTSMTALLQDWTVRSPSLPRSSGSRCRKPPYVTNAGADQLN